jgi:hypothetical protein
MAAPFTMPPRGHSSAPKFTPDVPRELQCYFKELELLFRPAQVVNDTEKKKHACQYVDIDTTDLWEAIPEFDVTKTFDEFKSAIFKLYPGSEYEHKWTIADMDKLVGEQLRMGILNVSGLRNYDRVFYTITQFLLTKNRISEAEQSQAFIRGFQLDLWHQISHRLEIKLPDHDPDNFYSLFEINEAAKHVLHGTSQNSFLQPSVTSTAPPTQPALPYVKAEDLMTLFEQMAQSFLKVLTPQKSTTTHASSSTNTQATTTLDLLSCAFCGQSGHFIAQCLICVDYITNEKCKRNPEGKIVLPNGQYTPHSIPGQFIKDRIDEWHKRNPVKSTSSSLMYEINPVATLSQTSVATIMVLTSSTNAFTADQRIAALEQEIFNLRNAKKTFDGVEILKPACTNKTVPTEQPKAPESTTESMPPPSQPAPVEEPMTMTQPPVHPFANVKETSYQPPHECNLTAAPTKPVKDKEPAYHYVAPVQTLRTDVNVYNKSMKTPLITLLQEELFAISPELHNRLCKDNTLKQALNKTVSTHALIEQVPDEVSSSVNNETHVIRSPEQSTLLCVYFSVCDLPDPKSSTFYNATCTPADSLTFTSEYLTSYTNLFLATKMKYKPIAKKVHPVIGELPKKFRIKHKIISNPLNDLPVLYPHSPPFVTTNLYTLEQ